MPTNVTRKKAVLYQECPLRRSGNSKLVPYSFTDSIESYQKAARQESWILENCNRTPTVQIVLRFHVVHDVPAIRKNWNRVRAGLNRLKIPFAAVLELSSGVDGYPDEHIHYHFLFDTTLTPETMREKMKDVCLNSKLGFYGKDFDLLSFDIPCWGQRMIHYFTKYGAKYERQGKVRLFKKGLRLRKFLYSRDWFVEQDGTRTTKAKILERLKAEYKQKITAKPLTANVSPFVP